MSKQSLKVMAGGGQTVTVSRERLERSMDRVEDGLSGAMEISGILAAVHGSEDLGALEGLRGDAATASLFSALDILMGEALQGVGNLRHQVNA